MSGPARRYPFMQVDAFTRTRLAGNPCAVVFDADDLDDATLLAIAREMNLAETSFVLTPRRSDVRARYFTLADEIPLAGHPTVATLHALVETGRLALPGGATTVSLEIGAGVIPVEVVADGGGGDPRHHVADETPVPGGARHAHGARDDRPRGG